MCARGRASTQMRGPTHVHRQAHVRMYAWCAYARNVRICVGISMGKCTGHAHVCVCVCARGRAQRRAPTQTREHAHVRRQVHVHRQVHVRVYAWCVYARNVRTCVGISMGKCMGQAHVRGRGHGRGHGAGGPEA